MRLPIFKSLLFLFSSVFFLWSCTNSPKKENKDSNCPEFYKIAPTPPMGWNSWDCYGPTVTEDEVKANADYMAENLKQYGWEYIVVDIRWYVENTKAQGYNQTDPIYCMDDYGRLIPAGNKFPSSIDGAGFKNLANYIHSKGLKFGIHIMRGIPVLAVEKNMPILGSHKKAADIYSDTLQCKWLRDMYTVDAEKEGAQEYYNSLFNLYAGWEVDYVKIDNLSRPYHQKEIELVRNAIDQCGRPMVLSISPGATPFENAEHVKTHANLWRICDDFWDHWYYMAPMFDLCKNWASHSAPGHWADADMLPLGRISIRGERGGDRMCRFTKEEQYTLMNLWAMFRSPLMFGGDLPSNDDFTLSLITNEDILAVNQHSTNNKELMNTDSLIVWTANIPNSEDKYVAFFNSRHERTGTVSIRMPELELDGDFIAKDLWTKDEFKIENQLLEKELNPHSSAIYRLSKQ